MLKNFKIQILIVILSAIFIGIFLVFREKIFTRLEAKLTSPLSSLSNLNSKLPSPPALPKSDEVPSPTPQPIDSTTNLEQYTKSFTPEDFSSDYQSLKNQL